MGPPWCLSGKASACQCRRHRFNPWVRKVPWRRKWQTTPGFLPGKSHGQRNLAGCSPWGHKESNTTEQLNENNNLSAERGIHSSGQEKEMATHSSVLAWRIPGIGEPGGLPSMGSLSLLQWIFLTQESNWGFLHCRQILHQLSY